jgi:hypothetical protein
MTPFPQLDYQCGPGCGPKQIRRPVSGPKHIAKYLILLGERAGDRTQDPVIKSHVLYHLSYALARGAV